MRRLSSMAAAVALAASITLGGGGANAAKWGENYFPNLPLTSHAGDTVRFYDDLIRGKIVVISFIYATCPDICSLTTARMAQVEKMLGDRVGRDIFMYSITLDPETDTPEILRDYAEPFQLDPSWLFLTGLPDDVKVISSKLGERSRTLSEHNAMIMLGNDTTGEWQRASAFEDLERIVQKISEMDPVYRNRAPQQLAVSRKQDDYVRVARAARIGGQQGQGLFLKACAVCHTIGNGDFVGPDLKDVSARRTRDWLTRFMIDPHRMRLQKDPIALSLDAQFPKATMPYLGLSEVDVTDLLAYIEAQSDRTDTAGTTTDPSDGG